MGNLICDSITVCKPRSCYMGMVSVNDVSAPSSIISSQQALNPLIKIYEYMEIYVEMSSFPILFVFLRFQ